MDLKRGRLTEYTKLEQDPDDFKLVIDQSKTCYVSPKYIIIIIQLIIIIMI